jgi:hypothetical protein
LLFVIGDKSNCIFIIPYVKCVCCVCYLFQCENIVFLKGFGRAIVFCFLVFLSSVLKVMVSVLQEMGSVFVEFATCFDLNY